MHVNDAVCTLLSRPCTLCNRRHLWWSISKIDIFHSNVNKLFIHGISHKKNCTMINELIFEKGSENKKWKVYFHELETPKADKIVRVLLTDISSTLASWLVLNRGSRVMIANTVLIITSVVAFTGAPSPPFNYSRLLCPSVNALCQAKHIELDITNSLNASFNNSSYMVVALFFNLTEFMPSFTNKVNLGLQH